MGAQLTEHWTEVWLENLWGEEFAWWPIVVQGKWVWLTKYHVRGVPGKTRYHRLAGMRGPGEQVRP